MQHLRGRHLEPGARGQEDARVGLCAAVFARAQLKREVVHQPDALQIGIAVAERGHRHMGGNARQRVERIRVAFHLVTRRIEHLVGRLQQRQIAAALAQRHFQRQPAQRAEVVMQVRVVDKAALTQLAHRLHRKALGSDRAVLAHPVVQHLIDPRPDRRKGPQRIVEVEGDGADVEAHRLIVMPGMESRESRMGRAAPLLLRFPTPDSPFAATPVAGPSAASRPPGSTPS